MLKFCSPVVGEHLSKAFNECPGIESFPECSETAKVNALHKEGDFCDLETCRRVSTLCSMSKVFKNCHTTGSLIFC